MSTQHPLDQVPRVASHPRRIKDITRDSYRQAVDGMEYWSSTNRWASPEDFKPLSSLDLARDLLSRTDLSDGTRVFYRAALLWHIRTKEPTYQEDLDALQLLNAHPGSNSRSKAKATKTKARTISLGDLARLEKALAQKSARSLWAYRTHLWLLAGLATGLRPVEWLTAAWDLDGRTLRVRTAKTKLSPPAFMPPGDPAEEGDEDLRPPVERLIPVDSDRDRDIVSRHLIEFDKICTAIEPEQRLEQFKSYHDNCRKVLYRASHEIWGGKNVVSLYTARSQFQANMRAAVGTGATAVLMGHSREDSPSASHYGTVNQAHPGFRERRALLGADLATQAMDQAPLPTPPTGLGA